MEKEKKLFWIEYTDRGPLLLTRPFETARFNTQNYAWGPDFPNIPMNNILPKIKSWQPDILVFWLGLGYMRSAQTVVEPNEWIEFCEIIRTDPATQHIKIMAYLGAAKVNSSEQLKIWDKRYDFWSQDRLRVIEDSILARHLVGEKTMGFEGVNYYLENNNGSWVFSDNIFRKRFSFKKSFFGAEGEFARIPKTRLLAGIAETGPIWHQKSIQANTPTSIVYIHKDPTQKVENKYFGAGDLEQLSKFIHNLKSSRQLLIGVSQKLLQASSRLIQNSLDQAKAAGDWQIFINEHMWFETMPGPGFDDIVYNGKQFERWEYPFTI